MTLRDVALRLLRGREEQRTIDSVPWDVGGPLRPASVSVDQALGLVPVFAAVRLLASQVASLPLQTYRKTGDTRQKINPWPLFVHPSVQGTLYDWLHRCMTSLALRGNAFGYITQRDRDQYPTMIEWLHPDDVRVDDRMPSGPGSYTSPVWYWQGRVIPAEDLLHIPWFTVPGRVLGLSPIGACAATISTGLSAMNYTSDWFDSGAVPPGEFKNTGKRVNQEEADIISARLNAAIKRRRPLVYGSDWEYKPIAVAAHEAKFIETMRMNATQIASIYGIPPEMIGGEAGGPLTYNTVESNAAGLEKFTLRPWLTLLEAAFFALMPRPQYVKFNVDSLLRTDLQTRMASYQTGRQIGLYNIDEARAIEDLPPLPNGEGQDYTPLQILTGRATQPATQTRYLPRHATDDYLDAEVIDERHGTHNQKDHGRPGVKGALKKAAQAIADAADSSDKPAPKRRPRRPSEPAGGRAGFDRRSADVAELARRPVRQSSALSGGKSASTELNEHDGGRLVHKHFAASSDGRIRRGKDQVDSEYLGALMASSVNAKVPAVARDGDRDVHMEFVDGTVGGTLHGERPPAALVDSDAGRLLGLADILMANADRNPGNWLIDADGDPVGIDHSLAFTGAVNFSGPFVPHFLDFDNGKWIDHDMSPADMAEVRRRVESLRPEFEQAGRGDWFEDVMWRLEQLEQHATGTRSRLT